MYVVNYEWHLKQQVTQVLSVWLNHEADKTGGRDCMNFPPVICPQDLFSNRLDLPLLLLLSVFAFTFSVCACVCARARMYLCACFCLWSQWSGETPSGPPSLAPPRLVSANRSHGLHPLRDHGDAATAEGRGSDCGWLQRQPNTGLHLLQHQPGPLPTTARTHVWACIHTHTHTHTHTHIHTH